MSDSEKPILDCANLSKEYGKVRALDGLSFRIQPGRVVGILGRNGAGKSTLIGLIAGLLRPNGGHLRVFGSEPPLAPALRRRIGFAPQRLALYEALTLVENLEIFAASYGLSGTAARDAIWRVLDLVDLTAVASRRVGQCSGGMKRRLNLAAALLHEADLILLDEPTAGVDIQSREKILQIVRMVVERGASVLYATHYIEETEMVCDDVLIIDRGRGLAFDDVVSLIRNRGGDSHLSYRTAQGERVSLRTPEPHRLLAEALSRGESLRDIEVRPPRMEDAFRSIVDGGGADV
ncbi:MAG: hypothetical protein Tsb008_06940 [Rhodothalassiaceae bacterium]